jgi:hypothetical protein
MRADDEPEEELIPVTPLVQEKPLPVALPTTEEPVLLKPPVETGMTTRPSAPGGCPVCRSPMQPGAVICLECGYDARIGRQRETVVRRVQQRWESGQSYTLRLIIFTVFFAVGAFLFVPLLFVRPVAAFLVIPWTIGCAAFWGDYFAFEIERNAEGRLLIRVDRCLFFVPLKRVTAHVEDFAALVVEDSRWFDYRIILMAFVCCPAFLYFGFRFLSGGTHQQSYRIYMRLHRRSDDILLYRGTNERKMREIVEWLQRTTDLPLERR